MDANLKPEGAASAAPAAAVEMVKLVNTGKGPIQILKGPAGLLKPNSENSITVPKELADKFRRAYPHVKNILDIFPDSPDISKLQAENADLRKKAEALEKLLNGSDLAKKEAADAFAAEKAAAIADWTKEHDALTGKVKDLTDKLELVKVPHDVEALHSKVGDLTKRLQAFLGAETRKDLDALKAEHKDAVEAPVAA
jgi:hypothetical protein